MKKISLIFILIVAFLISMALLTVGPLSKIVISQETILTEMVNLGDGEESSTTTLIETQNKVFLGNKVLEFLSLEVYKDNHLVMTVSSSISGLILGLLISDLIFYLFGKKKIKSVKVNTISKKDSSIKNKLPEPISTDSSGKNKQIL